MERVPQIDNSNVNIPFHVWIQCHGWMALYVGPLDQTGRWTFMFNRVSIKKIDDVNYICGALHEHCFYVINSQHSKPNGIISYVMRRVWVLFSHFDGLFESHIRYVVMLLEYHNCPKYRRHGDRRFVFSLFFPFIMWIQVIAVRQVRVYLIPLKLAFYLISWG